MNLYEEFKKLFDTVGLAMTNFTVKSNLYGGYEFKIETAKKI